MVAVGCVVVLILVIGIAGYLIDKKYGIRNGWDA